MRWLDFPVIEAPGEMGTFLQSLAVVPEVFGGKGPAFWYYVGARSTRDGATVLKSEPLMGRVRDRSRIIGCQFIASPRHLHELQLEAERQCPCMTKLSAPGKHMTQAS